MQIIENTIIDLTDDDTELNPIPVQIDVGILVPELDMLSDGTIFP